MKITLDTKSLLLGFLGAGLMFTAISFKNGQDQTGGRYHTEVNANNMVVILDTETGNYIVAPFLQSVGKVQWVKGEFNKPLAQLLIIEEKPNNIFFSSNRLYFAVCHPECNEGSFSNKLPFHKKILHCVQNDSRVASFAVKKAWQNRKTTSHSPFPQ